MTLSPHRFAPAVAVGLALVLSLGGCSGPSSAGKDTSAATKAPTPAPVVERTYDTPNVAISDDEFEELDGFCAAALECRRVRCDADEQARIFKKVRVKTQWGKALQKHCAGNPLPGVGRRLAKLVEAEGLGHRSRACQEVAARFD